ncbi:MAG: FKBP-type peptidyl-prolyl cis-trans isomerase [Candidatus Methanoplasma sp.]|jgi:FKBP-type peptidyl-prolyl cis-trans isomerase 2|nr:FKBP-type peptidyl-prolyl cis-trans isomerase [Candidatus Methanoplasma sp.]
MADDEFKVKKERDPIMMVCFVVFLLAVCAVSGATVYNNYLKADDTMAVTGSTVSVNYIGTYYAYYGEENSAVFDTSHWSIANNGEILKSNDFTLNAESSYNPLSFTVGGTSVLTGFGNAVIGHKVGDKVLVKLPAGEGYNAAETTVTVSASQAFTIQSTETLTSAQFKEIYGYDLKGYEEMEKSVYGWPASASYNTGNDTITITYHPQAGSSYVMLDNDFGKVTLNVTSLGSDISFTYSISDYKVVSTSGEIEMIMLDFGTQKWYINSVTDNNGVANSFTYRTTEERYNQDLYFEIEIVSIG